MKHQDSTMTQQRQISQRDTSQREVTQRDVVEEQKQLDNVISELLNDNMIASQRGLDPAKGQCVTDMTILLYGVFIMTCNEVIFAKCC